MEHNRSRKRVGRSVTYLPTDAEATTGNGVAGDHWPATISAVNTVTGLVNLFVIEADGGIIAKTDVALGHQKGQFTYFGKAA